MALDRVEAERMIRALGEMEALVRQGVEPPIDVLDSFLLAAANLMRSAARALQQYLERLGKRPPKR